MARERIKKRGRECVQKSDESKVGYFIECPHHCCQRTILREAEQGKTRIVPRSKPLSFILTTCNPLSKKIHSSYHSMQSLQWKIYLFCNFCHFCELFSREKLFEIIASLVRLFMLYNQHYFRYFQKKIRSFLLNLH